MNDFRNDTKQYTSEYIRQYLEGKLNASDMHAIEKAALEDSFLADAIEGMREATEAYGKNRIHSNLQQLREQIAAKAESGKVIPIRTKRWWPLVAAACLLIVSTVVVYNNWFSNEQKDTIAVLEQKKNLPETIGPASADNSIVKNDTSAFLNKERKDNSKKVINEKEEAVSVQKEEEKSSETLPSTIAQQEETPINLPRIKQPEKAKDITKVDASKADDQNKTIKSNSETNQRGIADKEPKAAPGKSNTADFETVNAPAKKAEAKVDGLGNNVLLNYFNGKITDKNNRPIANATVQLVNTNNGYLTDQNGFFKFSGTDTMVNVNVTVVGYTTQNFQLRNDISLNQLQLQPIDNNNLEEVVVTANGQRQRRELTKYKTKFPSVLVQDAEPANGWIDFDKYIEGNKKILDKENTKSGEVVISFLVNRNGVLSGFKIEQSLSPAQDAEGLRLLKEGPAWRVLKGKKTRVMVIIRF